MPARLGLSWGMKTLKLLLLPVVNASYSISNIIITSIERLRDAKGSRLYRRQRRSLTGKSQLLSMAEALSRLVPNADCRLILVIRHRQDTFLTSPIESCVSLRKEEVCLARLCDGLFSSRFSVGLP